MSSCLPVCLSVCNVRLRLCVIVRWASLPDTNKFDLIDLIEYHDGMNCWVVFDDSNLRLGVSVNRGNRNTFLYAVGGPPHSATVLDSTGTNNFS